MKTKTWGQSAAASARGTGYGCFAIAFAYATWQALGWLAKSIGIAVTVFLAAFVTFCIGTLAVRVFSRVQAEAMAEQQAYAASIKAQRDEIEAKIQYAQVLAQQASQWRPDAPLH